MEIPIAQIKRILALVIIADGFRAFTDCRRPHGKLLDEDVKAERRAFWFARKLFQATSNDLRRSSELLALHP
jgi:hypothetical protein